jgi:hypothetical protein
MGRILGPNSYLPGRVLIPAKNTFCDEHHDVPAVKEIVGETDSWGSETEYQCQACFDKMQERLKQEQANPEPASCDSCGVMTTDRKPTRDFEEGTTGPVYYCCPSCRNKLYAISD